LTLRRLDGKVAVVTGGGSGIGRASAMRLASDGAKVVVADLHQDRIDRVVSEIHDAGGQAVGQRTDVSVEAEVAAMIATAVRSFGALNILHNNASITNPSLIEGDLPLTEAEPEYWVKVFRVNTIGPMLGCKHAIPAMLDSGGGAIVNTSSGAGLAADLATPAYGASKAAVNMLTMQVATNFGRSGIRCNAVAPGLTMTEVVKANMPEPLRGLCVSKSALNRAGDPSEIAAVVAFLVSDESSYLTGQIIAVDGGLLCGMPYVGDFFEGRAQALLSDGSGG
jgi:NAD(P)-dependent dehydrogenase (short-subunit alcohol dehydrogenase family)